MFTVCSRLIPSLFLRAQVWISTNGHESTPTARSLQFDVQFDDGTQISRRDASDLLSILEGHQVGRDWKAGDLMVLDNATTMHAKTRHAGQREILVAMSGTVIE